MSGIPWWIAFIGRFYSGFSSFWSRSTFLNRFNARIEKVSIYRLNGDVKSRKIQRKNRNRNKPNKKRKHLMKQCDNRIFFNETLRMSIKYGRFTLVVHLTLTRTQCTITILTDAKHYVCSVQPQRQRRPIQIFGYFKRRTMYFIHPYRHQIQSKPYCTLFTVQHDTTWD